MYSCFAGYFVCLFVLGLQSILTAPLWCRITNAGLPHAIFCVERTIRQI